MKSASINIFIVDDDKILSSVLRGEIRRNFPEKDIRFSTFESGELCEPHIGSQPDIAIIDYHMNSRVRSAMNGIEVIDLFRKKSPDTSTILFTSDSNLGLAVEALTHGATDYVQKNDFMLRRLNVSLYQCFQLRDLKRRNHELKKLLLYASTALAMLAVAIYYFSSSPLFNPAH